MHYNMHLYALNKKKLPHSTQNKTCPLDVYVYVFLNSETKLSTVVAR
jgi:hypothetical protein